MKRRNFLASAHKKAYQDKRFSNPNATATPRRWKWRVLLGIGTLLLAAASIPFMLGFAPVFHITSVSVEGLTSIPDSAVTSVVYEQMSKKHLRIFPQNTAFYFQIDDVVARLNEQFDFARLEITAEGRGVHVLAEEKIIELIWVNNGTYYFLNLEGSLARPLEEIERAQVEARLNGTPEPVLDPSMRKLQPHMPIIIQASPEELVPEMSLVDEQFVSTVLAFDKGIRRHQITPFVYELKDLRSDFLRLKSSTGYDILFSTTDEAEVPLNNFEIILRDNAEKTQDISYIDLRFGNHVYIR